MNPPPLSVDLAFWVDAIGRMIVATAAGMTLGWERSRENRQIMGLRTLGLVGLASCIAVQAIVHSGLPNVNADAAGRAMQGILRRASGCQRRSERQRDWRCGHYLWAVCCWRC